MAAARVNSTPGARRPATKSRRRLSIAQQEIRRRNKPVFDGSRREKSASDRLVDLGLDARRNPGQRFRAVSTGRNYHPDAGAFLPSLAKLGVRAAPAATKDPRPDANVIFEVKSQRRSGSVDKKLLSTIWDLAHVGDEHRVVPVLVLDTPGLPEQTVDQLRHAADISLVAFITREELDMKTGARKLRSKIRAVAEDRARLRRKINASDGSVKRHIKRGTGTRASQIVDAYASRAQLAAYIK